MIVGSVFDRSKIKDIVLAHLFTSVKISCVIASCYLPIIVKAAMAINVIIITSKKQFRVFLEK